MSVYDFVVKNNRGETIALSAYKGKVLLIVNTATKYGLTPQYEALERLYQKYKGRGFEILDFPCNQFLQQAPGTDEEIQDFCQLNYNTTFPRFAKIDVNGESADPLYTYLKKHAAETEDAESKGFAEKLSQIGQKFVGSEIKWNFTKFLLDREGRIVARFAPVRKPEALEKEIEALI